MPRWDIGLLGNIETPETRKPEDAISPLCFPTLSFYHELAHFATNGEVVNDFSLQQI